MNNRFTLLTYSASVDFDNKQALSCLYLAYFSGFNVAVREVPFKQYE